MVATKLMSAVELEHKSSDSKRFELVRGELVEVSPASGEHGVIGMRLGNRLSQFVEPRLLGVMFNSDTGFVVEHDPDSVLMPDVSFVRVEKVPTDRLWTGYVPFAPDLAIEIQSPSNAESELLEKVAMYFRGGTSVVWLVRPKHRTITVFEIAQPERVYAEADVLDGGSLLPGFTLRVRDLFEPMPRPA